MVNDPETVFVARHRGVSGYHDEVFHDDDHIVRTLTKLLDDASTAHRKLDPTEGLQDAQLDDGARVHIVHGDVARGGHGEPEAGEDVDLSGGADWRTVALLVAVFVANALLIERLGWVISGGLLFWDGQLVDDARLVVGLARTAASHGAKRAGQRGAKAQPWGMRPSRGTVPSIACSRAPGVRPGSEASSPRVYGCFGSAKS